MAGPAGDVGRYRKGCVCGPFHNEGKINYPLWWYGDQGILYNFAGHGSYVVPTNCAFMGQGQYFNGGSSYLLDEQGRKILRESTTGLWSSINLDCTRPPACGSIVGSGTKLYLNTGNALPPKITGSLILYPQGCPNLTTLYCYSNSISTLDVSALTSLTHLLCSANSMNQAMVDTVLCDVDAYGTNNGTLNISGNAVPSAAGTTCKNNLVGRGWTVTTD